MTQKNRPTPTIGSVFEHKYKGETYRMEVVLAEWGLGYSVDGVGLFKSPTAAAKAVVGDQFINGWKFWKMDARNLNA